jgi:hypothetical protein
MYIKVLIMNELNDRVLSRLKDEYAEAVVENMTQRQAFSYLRQVIYNDVAVLSSEDVKRKIVKAFGEDKYQEMLEDAVRQTEGKTVPTTL